MTCNATEFTNRFEYYSSTCDALSECLIWGSQNQKLLIFIFGFMCGVFVLGAILYVAFMVRDENSSSDNNMGEQDE